MNSSGTGPASMLLTCACLSCHPHPRCRAAVEVGSCLAWWEAERPSSVRTWTLPSRPVTADSIIRHRYSDPSTEPSPAKVRAWGWGWLKRALGSLRAAQMQQHGTACLQRPPSMRLHSPHPRACAKQASPPSSAKPPRSLRRAGPPRPRCPSRRPRRRAPCSRRRSTATAPPRPARCSARNSASTKRAPGRPRAGQTLSHARGPFLARLTTYTYIDKQRRLPPGQRAARSLLLVAAPPRRRAPGKVTGNEGGGATLATAGAMPPFRGKSAPQQLLACEPGCSARSHTFSQFSLQKTPKVGSNYT